MLDERIARFAAKTTKGISYRETGAGQALARVAGTAPAITRAVLAIGARLIPEEALAAWEGGIEVFLNVNTPEDLALAERLVS